MTLSPLHRLILASLTAILVPLAVVAEEWRRPCEIAAASQGFRITQASDVRPTRSNERIVGYIVNVVLERGRDRVRAECDYSLRTAQAMIVRNNDRRRDDDARRRGPSEAQTEAACIRAAERRDFRITRLIGATGLSNDRRREVAREHVFNASRERRDWRVRCVYDYRSGETDVEFYRR